MAFNIKKSILPIDDNTLSLGSSTKRWKINDQEITFDTIYPIGAIYMSMNSIDPGTLFGGAWEQITGRFLLACDATYEAGNTGGSSTVSLQVENLPSHSHSVGAHAHGLNGHTHTSAAHTHGLNGHTHGVGSYSAASNGAHTHNFNSPISHDWYGGGSVAHPSFENYAGKNNYYAASAGSHGHSISGTSGGNSGNTTSTTPGDTGAATGSTANSIAFNSGSIGSGAAIDNMPPYLAVYVWQRVA